MKKKASKLCRDVLANCTSGQDPMPLLISACTKQVSVEHVKCHDQHVPFMDMLHDVLPTSGTSLSETWQIINQEVGDKMEEKTEDDLSNPIPVLPSKKVMTFLRQLVDPELQIELKQWLSSMDNKNSVNQTDAPAYTDAPTYTDSPTYTNLLKQNTQTNMPSHFRTYHASYQIPTVTQPPMPFSAHSIPIPQDHQLHFPTILEDTTDNSWQQTNFLSSNFPVHDTPKRKMPPSPETDQIPQSSQISAPTPETQICTPQSSQSSTNGATPVRRSPRKKLTLTPAAVTNEDVKLVETRDVQMSRKLLRASTSAALKNAKQCFTLMMKLLPGVFSVEEMALSRGQGLVPAKSGDLRPALDDNKISACKVMRLTKPTLMPFHPIITDSRDLPNELTREQQVSDIAKPKDLNYFGVSDLLTLPQNFGNIFLGETFSSYISVHNDSSQLCSEILLKADLQTSSQRLLLTGVNTQPVSDLKPEQSIDDVIQHEVKELGTHILVCAVSYTTESGEKMAFRKFFKFQVLKPLDVKTKFYNAESDDVYLEVQIQNITPGPVYMEHVRLDPSDLYLSKELNSLDKKEGTGQVFGRVDYLNAMDTRQYLYCLTPKPELYIENKVLKGVTNIGKLDIVWKTNLGEKGRLQTSQLLRVAPGYGDIRVTVEQVPDSMPLENTFDIILRIANCCEREIELTMVLQNDMNSGLLWNGLSGKKLGTLLPNESMDLPLTLITTIPGLQTISGLRLTDNFLKRTYEHDELAQVFVYNDSS